MAQSGSGQGTPIAAGGAGVTIAARPLPYTLLSLERYAQLMGLNPAHFWQTYSQDVFPLTNECPEVWYKYAWQKSGNISREDLAYEISQAEADLAQVLGYWPAPVWVNERVLYPQHHRPDRHTGHGLGAGGLRKGVRGRWGLAQAPGQRAVALGASGAAVTYSDEDGDGLAETATISADISGSAAAAVLEKGWGEAYASTKGLKVYFAGNGGLPQWEVRSPVSHSYAGTTLTAVFRSWQLVDPALHEAYPNADGSPYPIDLSDTGNLVSTVDVYLEYTDRGATSAQFLWEEQYTCASCAGAGCSACNPYQVTGCAPIRDAEISLFAPVPASYDSDEDSWTQSAVSVSREPNEVRLWYRAGALSQEYQMGLTDDPLSHRFAQAIAWLATARLQEEICACGNAYALAKDLRQDLSVASPEGNFIVTIDEVVKNPFGTRKGEVMAWRLVRKLAHKVITGAAL